LFSRRENSNISEGSRAHLPRIFRVPTAPDCRTRYSSCWPLRVLATAASHEAIIIRGQKLAAESYHTCVGSLPSPLKIMTSTANELNAACATKHGSKLPVRR
jgi:hypothetical protein